MRTTNRKRKGFTLVELVLAMLITALLMRSIFMLADGTVKSARAMVDTQSEEITRDAFFTMMRRHFEELPGNCRMELVPTSETEPFLSTLTFQNSPVAFNWGGVPISAEAMRIITVPSLNGINVVLEYYEEPILDSEESLAELGVEPIASVILLEDVARFEWNVLDGRNLNFERDEWPYEWEIQNRLPTFIELTAQFTHNGEVVRRMFWCPTKVSPLTRMRQLQSTARANRGAGGTGTTNPTQGDRNNPNNPSIPTDRTPRTPTQPPSGGGGTTR